MTKKRFHYQSDGVGIYYFICDGGKTEDKIFAEVIGDVKEVTDKLNELHEENEELKQELNYYKAMIHTDTSKKGDVE